MSEQCHLCQHLKTTPTYTGLLFRELTRCECKDVPFDDFLMRFGQHTEDDCPCWWPNKRQYTYGAGEWEHRCNRMPTDTTLLWSDDKAWYLWAGTHDSIRPLFCPWCGIELQPMPELKEGADE